MISLVHSFGCVSYSLGDSEDSAVHSVGLCVLFDVHDWQDVRD